MTAIDFPHWRDVWSLGKPRLSALVFCTTGVGLYAAPVAVGAARALAILACTALVVFGANGLNSYLERDADGRMARTRRRPLPDGRVSPAVAWGVSVSAAALATCALYRLAGPLTALLAFLAFASYVWLYTPMKRVHWAAVLVGAVPGAIPPMMGWCAATGRLGPEAWSLFALLFVWQIPHFFAIALSLADDYRQGGLVVLPHVVGDADTRVWTVRAAWLLCPTSLLPCAAGLSGIPYAAVAAASGAAFLRLCRQGLLEPPPVAWARRTFLASIVHMAVLLLALCLDASLGGPLGSVAGSP